MRDALIMAGLTLGAVALLFPAPEPPSPDGATPRPEPHAGTPTGRMAIVRAGDGHFYAPVTLGAKPVTMLVDTGASVIALTGADARAAGLVWQPSELRVVAQGAGGAVRGVAVTLDRVQLGPHVAHGVPAVIVPEGLPVSLLGQNFLRQIEPVQIEGDRMVLGG